VRVSVLTREWPPDVYGGAGVHVEQLVVHLAALVDVDVQTFGVNRDGAVGHQVPANLRNAVSVLGVLAVDLQMCAAVEQSGADIVHSHTWYTNFAGDLASRLMGVPHVITAHSLEPLRPWKAEQLGDGYRVSRWIERSAYAQAAAIIAVSEGMARDIAATYPEVDPLRVHVVHNGIDTLAVRPTPETEALTRLGVDPQRPYILFVGRITRQKGLELLLAAAPLLDPAVQIVLIAATPDTPELGDSVRRTIEGLQRTRSGVHWVGEQVSRSDLLQYFSHAAAFICPSIYEPLGIVNLEAMACGTAVIASRVGGIPEVVADGRTGILLRTDPADAPAFAAELAATVNELIGDPPRASALGIAGRQRAVAEFGWAAIAARTVDVYRSALEAAG